MSFRTMNAAVCLLLAGALPSSGPALVVAGEPIDPLVQMVVDLVNDADRDMRALGLQQVREAVPGAPATKESRRDPPPGSDRA